MPQVGHELISNMEVAEFIQGTVVVDSRGALLNGPSQ